MNRLWLDFLLIRTANKLCSLVWFKESLKIFNLTFALWNNQTQFKRLTRANKITIFLPRMKKVRIMQFSFCLDLEKMYIASIT